MSKPFLLTFSYTPKWKGNRDRDAADQIRFTLRDLQESKRVLEQDRIAKALVSREKVEESKKPEERQFGVEWALTLKQEQIHLAYDLVRRHVVKFEPFQIEDDLGQVRDIKDFDGMCEHCSDLVGEIFQRLLNGPDADEIKN